MRFFALLLFWVSVAASSEPSYWQDVPKPLTGLSPLVKGSSLEKQIRTLTLDKGMLELRLSSDSKTNLFILPLPDGNDARMRATETHTLAPGLASKFPDIKTYKLVGVDDQQELAGRMEFSEQGVHIALKTKKGRKVFIEPLETTGGVEYTSSWGDLELYQKQHHGQLSCQNPKSTFKISNTLHTKTSSLPVTINPTSFYNSKNSLERSLITRSYKSTPTTTNDLIIYRLAISATKSYVAANGGTKSSAMRSIASIVNRINEVYERDAGIRFELVANNEQLIAPASAPFFGDLDNMIAQNQRLVDKEIGSQHYDIGHLFTAQGGGLAFVHSACRDGIKARGVSGNLSVGRERYALEFVAHEIGHQLGATHTFNSNEGLCTSSNRHSSTAYEPGSGSTIMSYIGICGSDNLQNHADAMFHIGSILQILEHKNKYYQNGCGVILSSSNNAPDVSAGADYIIPVNTPFELSGTASDIDNGSLLYSWQQVDAGVASNVDVDKGNNALFRTYLPTSSKHRRFPRTIVGNGKRKIVGETLPQTNRLLHFKFVAQDNSGATASDDMTLKVVAGAGAFSVNPIASSSFVRGEALTVEWDVADTDLPPISCAAVDITMSINNGLDFVYSLVKAVPNSGYEVVTLPDVDFDQRDIRIKVSCSDNVFFAMTPESSELDVFGNTVNTAFNTTASSSSLGNEIRGGVSGESSSEPQGAGGSLSVNSYWLVYLLLIRVLTRKRVVLSQ